MMKTRVISVVRLGRSFIYRPLAALLIILLPPMLFSGFEGDTGVKSFPGLEASAQIITNTIIQNYCGAGGVCYFNDLSQLESDGVSAYLGLHSLPPDDAHIIYDNGRTDLRSAVRAVMLDILLGIIAKPASSRTPHEQTLYTWLQVLVQQNEITDYTLALQQFNSWQSDPCHFTLDPTIAQQYNISYDGTPFCFGGSLSNLFGGPSVPAESYFTAYGLENSYGKPASTSTDFPKVVAGTGINLGEVVGIAAAASGVVVGAAAAALAASLSAALALGTGAAGIAAATATSVLSGATVAAFGTIGLVVGAVAIVLLAIAIGVTAGIQVFNNQQEINDLNNLNNTLAQVTNTPPDLNAFATDTSGLGGYKLTATFDAQTMPERASTTTLPSHQDSDLNFAIQKSTDTSPTITSTLAYQDWNGVDWSAQTYGNWLVQTCAVLTGCPQADTIIGSIHYLDWSGVKWTAARVGDKFVNVKGQPASTDKACPADLTGVSPGTNFSTCSSYVSTSIPLQDPTGALETVSLQTLSAPGSTGPATLPFTPGAASSQTINGSGNPTPQICYYSSSPALPSDFSANGASLTTTNCTTNGSFVLSFDGNSSSPDQTYQLTLASSNGTTTSPVLNTFNVVVSPQLKITSPAELDGNGGVPLNFVVTTTGSPPPALSTTVSIPGVTFTDNGDGTGTFSGIPGPENLTCIVGTAGCSITATSTQGTVTQVVSINIASAPIASLGAPTSATFVAGALNSVLLYSTGAITPVTWSFDTGFFGFQPPQWLVLTDNGNGTATLSGIPPLADETLTTYILPAAAYSSPFIIATFPLTIENIPVFLSPSTATFTVGTQGKFLVRANQGTLGVVNILPAGLSFLSGNNLNCLLFNIDGACIAGTPAAGTGGQYNLTLTDNAGALGSTTQALAVNIDEAPQITSATSAIFFTGMPNSFAVTTRGYPSVSTQPLGPNPTPPISPNDGKGTYFTVTGLPADLQFSNLNPEGFAGGTLTIQGTPSTSDVGMHQVQITAQNGVGAIAQQTLALNVIKLAGPAPTSGTKCNGAYNGTFQGNVTVSAGQNCMFVGGGITGNVSVNGGNLALTNANVGGNIGIQGSSAFSIGTGSTIGKNLSLQNITSAVSTNQVCGTKVAGNATVYANATPVQLGSAGVSCPGNSFGGNVSVTYDTGATGVYNNKVSKNLSCSNNTSISGGGNSAVKKQGQCVTF